MKKFNVGQVMGWKGESTRHSLARRGVKTGKRSDSIMDYSSDLAKRTEKRGEHLYSRGSSSDMREFRFNDHISILAHSESTRSGFRHIAVLMIDGREVDSAKVTYLNRTWESYEYQTVMQKLIEKTSELNPEQKKSLMEYARKDHTDWSGFEMTAKIAKLGEVFGNTEKEKNDWKARMLKAGLGNSGLEMPEDWDTLSEEEKKRRLDGAISVLNEHKKKPLTAKGLRNLGTDINKANTKEKARQVGVDFQHWSSEQDMSYSELLHYQTRLEDLAKKFGLVREFKENGII